MDKKSFIRGFGTGVLFTAVILGISFFIRTSDSFVTSRARELGMVYAADKESKGKLVQKETETEAPVSSASALPTATSKPAKQDSSAKIIASPPTTSIPAESPAASPLATKSPKATKAPSKQKSSDKEIDMEKEKKRLEKSIREEEKKLTISVGDWSSDVSKKLENLGIIDSASDFDNYLEKNGYSTSITAGSYDVSMDDTYQELARKITGK